MIPQRVSAFGLIILLLKQARPVYVRNVTKLCYNRVYLLWSGTVFSQSTVSEGGPKNLLKGTSMKFLMLASGAHLGVDAE
ncbi:hypothetical protein ERICI_03330 [Paenibacillus larvae subsp. larvae]|uniref:Uncharacterized protein n=1 Tax=Paenibacillus larvae subsp. larvae TaxID=147375 RepID=A0A6C0QQQ7_9BACL|nr:hypothetical protein BXP28_00650 [Paenibacillus larvae subsp. larvae]AVF23100.1 hypothetical protein ERICI_03330 [Paenibacillus larvae subsp. larvae]AVG13585.1 hypothetical protein ERICII_03273 [Paenibacillus larvae subsp. larvae DSM 25430]QHZ50648.1 hypothetical protein ERICV_01489 [Paenibacillus larvae subsp. larvae]